MAAGPLDKRVTIQNRQTAPDSVGQVITTWTDGDTVWASIEPLRGQELVAQAQVQADATHRVRMRWRDGVTVLNRLKFGTRLFEITEARNLEESNVWLELICQEAVTP